MANNGQIKRPLCLRKQHMVGKPKYINHFLKKLRNQELLGTFIKIMVKNTTSWECSGLLKRMKK